MDRNGTATAMKHATQPGDGITIQNLDDLLTSDHLPGSEFYRKTWLERIKERAKGRLSLNLLSGLLVAVDGLLVILAGLCVQWLYLHGTPVYLHSVYLVLTASIALAAPVLLQSSGGYASGLMQPLVRQTVRIAALMSGLLMVTMAAIFLFKLGDNYSRVWLVGFFAMSTALLIASHAAMRAQMEYWHRQGRLSTRVVIVGGGEPAEQLISSLHASNNNFVELIGLFDDRNDDRSPQAVGRLPKLGKIEDLVGFTRTYGVDMLVISLPVTAESRLLQIMQQLWVLPVDIRLSAHSQRLRYRPRAYSWLGNVPMIDVFDQPLRDWGRLLKTIEDKVIASVALLLLSPVMLAVAIAIRLESKGPVLFRQQRYGFNNQPIEVLKFRSMYTDMCDARANRLVTRDDPRVTRVGRFIRKTSLDELPQLINVLRGELSLVGPRPHAHHAKAANRLYDDVVDGYFARHKVKPGITGWAQINGWRGETDTEDKIRQRVEFDLYYIENWSLLFDLQILLMTPFALLKSENAY
jgi:Undecaprenyl-phosphate glucose phosphotransferase